MKRGTRRLSRRTRGPKPSARASSTRFGKNATPRLSCTRHFGSGLATDDRGATAVARSPLALVAGTGTPRRSAPRPACLSSTRSAVDRRRADHRAPTRRRAEHGRSPSARSGPRASSLPSAMPSLGRPRLCPSPMLRPRPVRRVEATAVRSSRGTTHGPVSTGLGAPPICRPRDRRLLAPASPSRLHWRHALRSGELFDGSVSGEMALQTTTREASPRFATL